MHINMSKTYTPGSASPTSQGDHISGEEMNMDAHDYYRSLEGATKADIDAIAIQVRQQARHDIALLVEWNVWLCGAIDVARSLAKD